MPPAATLALQALLEVDGIADELAGVNRMAMGANLVAAFTARQD